MEMSEKDMQRYYEIYDTFGDRVAKQVCERDDKSLVEKEEPGDDSDTEKMTRKRKL